MMMMPSAMTVSVLLMRFDMSIYVRMVVLMLVSVLVIMPVSAIMSVTVHMMVVSSMIVIVCAVVKLVILRSQLHIHRHRLRL